VASVNDLSQGSNALLRISARICAGYRLCRIGTLTGERWKHAWIIKPIDDEPVTLSIRLGVRLPHVPIRAASHGA
jgi:hypothetical protein